VERPVSDPYIEVTGGPYAVRGLPLLRRRIVTTERAEPLVWETVERLEVGPSYDLCRCGGSANKPFCDGSHRSNGFEGEEVAQRSYDTQARSYEGTGLLLRDDRSRCAHAGFCATKLSNVWKQVKDDEVADTRMRSHVMAAVSRCPSGALTYRLPGATTDGEEALLSAVSLVPGGPLFVTGGVTIIRQGGAAMESRQRLTLCRCGASKNKPLCDGSHSDTGFTDS